MMGPAWLLSSVWLLAALPAAAEGPALNLGLPPDWPAPPRVAAAQDDAGFTLNAEVLQRYGFTLSQYQNMPSDEQRRVEEWVRVLEHERRAAAARGQASAPAKPAASAEEQAALARLRAAALAAGSFDGAPTPSGSAAFTPRLELEAGPNGEGVRRLSLIGKDGLTLEAGTLGLDSGSPLVSPSPYVGLAKKAAGSGSVLDYDLEGRAYAVDLGARLYSNDAPGLDAQIDQGLGALPKLQPYFDYSTDFQSQWLPVLSGMARVGRAYHLLPGVDVGWSSMALARVTGIFPDASLDQTVGARVDAGHGSSVGVFGGVSEAPGLFSKSMVADSLAAQSLQTDLHVDAAPHAELAAWGRLPYLSNAQYTLSTGQQWNPWTTVRSLSGSVSAPVGQARVGVFGRYSDESGPDIEYDRRKASAGVSVTPTPGLDLSAQYNEDSAQYGSAAIDSRGVFLSAKISEPDGPAKGASVTFEGLFGGQEQLVSPDEQSKIAQLLQQALDGLNSLKGAALGAAGGPAAAWQNAQAAWAALPPAAQAALQEAWSKADPSAPPLASIMATPPSEIAALNKLAGLLSDTDVLERLLVRAIRVQVLKALDGTQIPILGQKIQMSPAMLLAAAHSYGLSLSPVPPITQQDVNGPLSSFLLGQASGAAGCPSGPQPQATTGCILSKLPPAVAASLQKTYGGDINALLQAAVQWPAQIIQNELDRTALQVILAAETLDSLSADQGEKIADLNVRGLIGSFSALDERSQRQESAVLQAAARDVGGELSEGQDKLRRDLTEYGSARLSWLQQQPAWPSNVRIAVEPDDWPGLMAIYGDAKLFDLILRCKAALAAEHPSGPARLLVSLDESSPLGGVTIVAGNPAELRLPRRAADLSLLTLRFQ